VYHFAEAPDSARFSAREEVPTPQDTNGAGSHFDAARLRLEHDVVAILVEKVPPASQQCAVERTWGFTKMHERA
jgi:hypothetical protein